MVLTEKGKTILAVSLFTAMLISLVYNLSIDPRSLYDPGDSNSDKLIKKQRIHKRSKDADKERDLVQLYLLKGKQVRYASDRGRNIFTFTEKRKPVKADEASPLLLTSKPTGEETEKPKPDIFVPFTYVGFAIVEKKNVAIIKDNRNSKIYVSYENGYINRNEFLVKEITPKKITMVRLSNHKALEIER
jgi:hypothetical protein